MTYSVINPEISVVIEDDQLLSVAELAELCQLNERWVFTLIEHGILTPVCVHTEQHFFTGQHLTRALKARRIQQDFEASFASLGLILELMDELTLLRQFEQSAQITDL